MTDLYTIMGLRFWAIAPKSQEINRFLKPRNSYFIGILKLNHRRLKRELVISNRAESQNGNYKDNNNSNNNNSSSGTTVPQPSPQPMPPSPPVRQATQIP